MADGIEGSSREWLSFLRQITMMMPNTNGKQQVDVGGEVLIEKYLIG